MTKALAWRSLYLLVCAARGLAVLGGRTRRVDVIIYKVDRLGDWLLAEPSVARIVAATKSVGGTAVVWAGRESDGLRKWRAVDCPVVTLVFEPRGWVARAKRTWAVIRLLATYRAETLYCLRHAPDPIRDFVLRTVAAKNIYALSWRIFPGDPEAVPHEVRRHNCILDAAGLAPTDVRELLPRLTSITGVSDARIVIAPFSSALVKDWPDASWRAVVSTFASRARIWEIWVGPDQIPRAERLAELLRQQQPDALRVSVRSGSLADLGETIASADLVLAVDTLAAHIAVAMNARMIGILGGGQYGDFAPWSHSERQRWVSYRLPCFHCSWHCTRPQNDCLQLITPAAVVAEMQSLWNHDSLPNRVTSIEKSADAGLPARERS